MVAKVISFLFFLVSVRVPVLLHIWKTERERAKYQTQELTQTGKLDKVMGWRIMFSSAARMGFL